MEDSKNVHSFTPEMSEREERRAWRDKIENDSTKSE